MRVRHRLVRGHFGLALAAAIAAAGVAVPEASSGAGSAEAGTSGVVEIAENPCLDPVLRGELLCPDLTMRAPFDLAVDRARGRTYLRAANSIDSRGAGPAELHGRRSGRYTMRAEQRIYARDGGHITLQTGAELYFKPVPGQYRYWKYRNAARFELWSLDSRGRRVTLRRVGPKISYCLRDLVRTRPSSISPPRRVYPACSQNARAARIRLGTSVGWSDGYPASYPEQWVDVTGLRGCFAYVHIADPNNGVYESNEANNEGVTTVRLPYGRPGPRCPRARGESTEPPPPTSGEDPY